jgi:hypothetical protein
MLTPPFTLGKTRQPEALGQLRVLGGPVEKELVS